MATLNDWFEKKDYGIGLALLAKHSRNRFMIQNLSRKANPAKLEYELKKLLPAEVQVTKVKPEVIIPGIEEAPVIKSEVEEVPRELRQVNNSDALPPDLKKLWEANRDAYKEIRALHEKLKLMAKAPAEDRKPLTMRIAELDDKIRANWEVIDAWQPSKEPEVKEPVLIDHKRINSNRKFISVNLKKLAGIKDEDKAGKIRNEMALRYNELIGAGEKISQETIAELSKAGIDI